VVFNCARNHGKRRRPATAAVELRGVYRRFGRTMVLAGFDLRVGEGELYGLIGPNGAGKTTALRVALGLLQADAGQVTLLGRDPRSAAGARPRRVGSLIEAPALSPRLTGREYLLLIARWAQASDAEVDRVVGLLGLGRMTDRPTATYSSGMRQVLATAAALVGPPDLLVLDEPTVGLDPGHRRRVNDLLLDHVDRGGTVLLSSHQLDDAERLCTRVGLMAAGRLLEEGPPTELGPAAGRFEVTVSDPEAALSALRALRLICWRDDDKVLVETGAPYQVGRPDGSAIARALAAAGVYPSDLRRSPTLELAYAEVTSGLAPDPPRPPWERRGTGPSGTPTPSSGRCGCGPANWPGGRWCWPRSRSRRWPWSGPSCWGR
jgi:ABC-2 type transport system ATP-binding protein